MWKLVKVSERFRNTCFKETGKERFPQLYSLAIKERKEKAVKTLPTVVHQLRKRRHIGPKSSEFSSTRKKGCSQFVCMKHRLSNNDSTSGAMYPSDKSLQNRKKKLSLQWI